MKLEYGTKEHIELVQYPEYRIPFYHYIVLYLNNEQFNKLPKKIIKQYYNGIVIRITNIAELEEISYVLTNKTKHLLIQAFYKDLKYFEIEKEK